MHSYKHYLLKAGIILSTATTFGSIAATLVINIVQANVTTTSQAQDNTTIDLDSKNGQVINSTNDGNKINREIDQEMQNKQIPKANQSEAQQQMKDLFDPSSENYMNAKSLTVWAEQSNSVVAPSNGAHGWISDSVLGSAFNFAIGAVVMGVAGGIGGLVKKKGKQFVLKLLKSRLKATMAAMGLSVSGYILGKAIEFALDITSPGDKIAEFIDNHEKNPATDI